MKNLFGRFFLCIILPLGIAIAFLYPPTARNLITFFEDKGQRRDETFSQIVSRARALEATNSGHAFSFTHLRTAIGTNDIQKYFPQYVDAKEKAEPTTYILNQLQKGAAGKIRLGIDLQGGTAFQVRMRTTHLGTNSDTEAVLSEAVEVLRKRIDKFGVAEPIIQPEGDNQISIQLPGLSEANREEAKKQIQQAAYLEFRMVHPNNDQILRNGELAPDQIVPPGYEILRSRPPSANNKAAPRETYVVRKKAEMTGSAIRSAFVSRDNMGKPEILFRLNSEGAAQFAKLTTDNVNQRMAIVLDGELYSAPNIREPILGGEGSITGNYDLLEARRLASALENPLRAPLEIMSATEVDPTLGTDSIRSGMIAVIIAAVATFCFMFVFYFFVGFIANFALALNVVILLGLMCSIGTTLTLPGIAGIALAIGMAVDANVLIYERLREEMAAGKSLRGAISAAYRKAFGTIFDSNLTTLISAVILIWLGAGPVKGFGVTLAIGLCVHMFTALVVTRFIFDFLLQRNLITTIRILPVMKGTTIDFLRGAVPVMILSGLLVLGGIGYGFSRGMSMFGVEFVGGDSMTYSFAKKVDVDKVREAINTLGVADPTIQYQKSSASETLRVTTRDVVEPPAGTPSAVEKVKTALAEKFPDAQFKMIGQEKVGATVGKEIQKGAFVASVLALFAILAYVAFRYEFSFAVAAVAAGIHDVLLTLGLYILLGREINGVLVAAVLTIIGYSINDKIVILDRIREDLKLGVRGSFREIINIALNQTLSRTIITGGSVILSTLALLIFGGGAIKDFAIAFLIGTIVGTYSSIFIASPIVLWWHKGQRPKLGAGAIASTDIETKSVSASA